jgi:hypothetical protein
MQNDTAVIKCAQCGAQLIVPDCSEYVDNTGSGTFGNASLAATLLKPQLRAGDANRIAKATRQGPRSPQKRKSVTTGCMSAKD